MEAYVRRLIRRYHTMLLKDARRLREIDGWLNSKKMMLMMDFRWKWGVCILRREIEDGVKRVVDTIHEIREKFKYYGY